MTERAERLLALAEELGLTEKQREFCLLYIADPERNATRAAERAGYEPGPGLRSMACENLTKPDIQRYMAAIEEATGVTRHTAAMVERRVMSATEVLQGLSEQADADVAHFLARDQNGTITMDFDLEQAQRAGKTKLIKELTVRSGADKDGMPWTETKIKLVDSQGALDKLAKAHKIYKDDDEGPKGSVTIGKLLVQVIGQSQTALPDVARKLLGDVVDAEEVE